MGFADVPGDCKKQGHETDMWRVASERKAWPTSLVRAVTDRRRSSEKCRYPICTSYLPTHEKKVWMTTVDARHSGMARLWQVHDGMVLGAHSNCGE